MTEKNTRPGANLSYVRRDAVRSNLELLELHLSSAFYHISWASYCNPQGYVTTNASVSGNPLGREVGISLKCPQLSLETALWEVFPAEVASVDITENAHFRTSGQKTLAACQPSSE